MNTHRHISHMLAASALVALAATTAACGSSSPSSSTTPSTTPTTAAPTSSATSSPSMNTAAATAAITTNWEKFFSAKTPVATRVSLLEDGSQFPSAALAPSGIAAEASAKVVKVTNVTPTQATVTYDVLLGTTPALTNKVGTAVYQDGTWKVGVGSFCGLLSLESGGKGLPPACSSSSPSSSTSS
jgi:hypothetical protein